MIQSKQMDDGDDDYDEPVHYDFSTVRNRRLAAAAERRQSAATDRFQRLEIQLQSLKVLLDGANVQDYINRMIIEAYAVIVERGSVKNESNESPLIRQLNGSNWFKQLLKLQSILKEYLTAEYRDCTPNEIKGLDKYWNKYPCSMRDGLNWAYTKKWDFYCSNKGRIDSGRIDSEYVQNYIKRAEDFLEFLKDTQQNKIQLRRYSGIDIDPDTDTRTRLVYLICNTMYSLAPNYEFNTANQIGLEADEGNRHDRNAIKVMDNQKQIAWIASTKYIDDNIKQVDEKDFLSANSDIIDQGIIPRVCAIRGSKLNKNSAVLVVEYWTNPDRRGLKESNNHLWHLEIPELQYKKKWRRNKSNSDEYEERDRNFTIGGGDIRH